MPTTKRSRSKTKRSRSRSVSKTKRSRSRSVSKTKRSRSRSASKIKRSRSRSVSKSTSSKIYQIHNNGSHPYSVHVKKTTAEIINNKTDKLAKTVVYKKIFVGDNSLKIAGYAPNGKYPGNTILFELPQNKYLYVAEGITELKPVLGEKILNYYSPVGNSDVPYPYAVGENNTYLLAENVIIPNQLLNLKKDVYGWYYTADKKYIKSLKLKNIKRK